MSERKVLVTGGAGFLGINLVRHLMARGYRTTSIDIVPFDYPERGRVEIVKGDVRDKTTLDEALFEAHTYPGSGHLFADPGLDEHDPDSADSMWPQVLDLRDRVV